MIIPKKVLNEMRDHDIAIQDMAKELEDAFPNLTLVEKLRISKIEKSIYKIIKGIELDSGWTYTPGRFDLRTGFHYDSRYQVIDYDMNTVDVNKGINEHTSTQYEMEFYVEYEDLLKRLANLLRKRSAIVSPHTLVNSPHVIDFTKVQADRKWNKDVLQDMDYIEAVTINFMTVYGTEGINRIITLLNELVTSKDLLATYHNQFRGGYTISDVREMYFWAASFSPKAQYTIDLLERMREERERELTPELRELIR